MAKRSGCFDRRLQEIFFAQERQEKVRCVRLEQLLKLSSLPLALLKMDIEGAELEALRGAGLEMQRLAVEVHGSEALRELKAIFEVHFEVWDVPQELIPDHFMLYATPPVVDSDLPRDVEEIQ